MAQRGLGRFHLVPRHFHGKLSGSQLRLGLAGAGLGTVAFIFGHHALPLAQRGDALKFQFGVIGLRSRGGRGLLGDLQGSLTSGHSRLGLGTATRIEHFRG